jgi:hypothetical protein
MFYERTTVGLDVHARSVAAEAVDWETGQVLSERLVPANEGVRCLNREGCVPCHPAGRGQGHSERPRRSWPSTTVTTVASFRMQTQITAFLARR